MSANTAAKPLGLNFEISAAERELPAMKSALALFLPLLLSLRLHADVKPVVVPFTLTGADMIVRVKLNGREARLVVDTGASDIVLRAESAAALNLPLPNTSDISDSYGTLDQFQLGRLQWKDVYYSYLSKDILPADVGHDGLLGLEVMEEYAVGFDLQKRQMTFWKGGNLTLRQVAAYLRTGNSSVKPITLAIEQETNGGYRTVVQLNNQRVAMIIDTGSPYSFLGVSVSEALSPLRQSVRFEAQFLFGKAPAVFSLLRLLRLGELDLPYPLVPLSETPKNNPAKHLDILGMDVLAHSRFILDFPAEKLHLTPTRNEWVRLTGLWGQLGVSIFDQDRLIIHSDTAAAQTGMPQVVSLLRVNGIPLAQIKNAEAVAARLRKSESFVFTVLVEKEQRAVNYRFSSRTKLETSLPVLAKTAKVLSSEPEPSDHVRQPYSLQEEKPIVVPPDADIHVLSEHFLEVEDPPTGKYPHGAMVYTPAYRGKFPDAPAAQWRALGRGVIAILNAPTPAKP